MSQEKQQLKPVPEGSYECVTSNYRDNLGIVLFNRSEAEFEVKKADLIARHPELKKCKSLDETERGDGGFGSTGEKGIAAKNGTSAPAAAVEVKTPPAAV